jgi:hypothetical protein
MRQKAMEKRRRIAELMRSININCRAQLQIEAAACLCAFIALISCYAAVATGQNENALHAADSARAQSYAFACSLVADSMFANSCSGNSGIKLACFPESRHSVSGRYKGEGKTEYSIAKNMKTAGNANNATLEVETLAHYG